MVPSTTILAALIAAVAFAGCADNSKYANVPRPAQTLTISAIIAHGKVDISPTTFGAGLTRVVATNQSGGDISFKIEGDRFEHAEEIVSGATSNFSVELAPGTYTFGTDDAGIEPSTVEVGPGRPSSKDKVLLP